jgi:hypothetical protein
LGLSGDKIGLPEQPCQNAHSHGGPARIYWTMAHFSLACSSVERRKQLTLFIIGRIFGKSTRFYPGAMAFLKSGSDALLPRRIEHELHEFDEYHE